MKNWLLLKMTLSTGLMGGAISHIGNKGNFVLEALIFFIVGIVTYLLSNIAYLKLCKKEQNVNNISHISR